MANWTAAHVRRLFWRAGFGARPDEVRQWTRRGKDATIDWLVGAQGEPRYTGPAPSADGRPLDPLNEFGHDRLLWLDRMVRTGHPLREKMTLFWHDHFATFGQPTPLMLAQNDTQRRLALESFDELLRAMTLDPALGRALSLTKSAKKDPNENFGRELFELYTLGGGHTEDDVREAARALTGLREIVGAQGSGVVFDPARHDGGVKTIFGVSGALDWEDVLRMSVEHPAHAPFLVGKLWDFFVGTPIDAGRRAALASVYVSGGRRLRPVLRQILADPALYRKLGSPEMVKWPAVYVAGQLRAMRAPVDRVGYGDLMAEMGQALFAPPSVAGWDWGHRVAVVGCDARALRAGQPPRRQARPGRRGAERRAARPAGEQASGPGDRRRRPSPGAAAHAHGARAAHPQLRHVPAERRQRRAAAAHAAPPAHLRSREPALLMARSNPYTACEDFHRTAATDRHPSVGVSRRHFLGSAAGGALALYTAQALPLQHWIDGADEAAAAAPDAPMLVSVFLPGGLDLLDTFADTEQDGVYRDARAEAARPLTAPLAGTTLSPHPALSAGPAGGLRGIFESGQMGLLPGIDYANPDLSHFHSRHFWETGTITAHATTGWLGRWLDAHGTRTNPFQGVTSGSKLSPTLLTGGAPVSSINGVRDARLGVPLLAPPAQARAMRAYRELTAGHRGDGTARAAARTSARLAQQVSERLGRLDDRSLAGAGRGYPAGSVFAERMRQTAFLLDQPLGTRVATVDCTGDFDTHDSQPETLNVVLADVSATLSAFQEDLRARGIADRVLTFVWTEFGRRLRGNRSLGTDHGAGGIAWVMGPRAAPGVLTEYPSLRRLDRDGNLRVTADFREVYASIIEQWLGTGADRVIPDAAAMRRVKVVR
jgi:uncharacterized protein (DUF1501 family)